MKKIKSYILLAIVIPIFYNVGGEVSTTINKLSTNITSTGGNLVIKDTLEMIAEIYKELKYRSYFNVSKKSDSINNEDPTIEKAQSYLFTKFEKISTDTLINKYKSIYGDDDRIDIYLASEDYKNDAKKVVCLVYKNMLRKIDSKSYRLNTFGKLGAVKGLCLDQNFYDQPLAGFCSGFAVSENVIATAGHCFRTIDLSSVYFIFGFSMLDYTNANTIIPEEDVYEAESSIDIKKNSDFDYALIKVTKQIPKYRIAEIRTNNIISNDEVLHVIGHPTGLPAKISPNAKIFDNVATDNFFRINSDTFAGNSGSPVFNSKTHIVEGILVSGAKDYTDDNTITSPVRDCKVVFNCPQTVGDCVGEGVSRTTQFSNLLK